MLRTNPPAEDRPGIEAAVAAADFRIQAFRSQPLRRTARRTHGRDRIVTGHETLGGRLIRPNRFDVRGCKHILDAGCGNGRYSVYLLETRIPTRMTAFDLSTGCSGGLEND